MQGDMLVADENFGCGSAMEVAVTAVVAAGIKAVLARSFARTYYRNAVNNGLIPLECDTSGFREGDIISLILTESSALIRNDTLHHELSGRPFPKIILDILAAGGIVPYFLEHGGFKFS
jgi:3-isopropylmalate/(R)-2-methylmalate dehydratase small subunit